MFLRFSGCNLWDGHPLHRDKGQGECARWCDTDFYKGTPMSTETILERMAKEWPYPPHGRWCVLTGGEPCLQLDLPLVHALHDAGWFIAIETNGTIDNPALASCDWVCVSPKLGGELLVKKADELKVILPGTVIGLGWTDDKLDALRQSGSWQHLYVQPQDPQVYPDKLGPTLLTIDQQPAPTAIDEDETDAAEDLAEHLYGRNMARCQDFVQLHPQWGLSVQLHKLLSLP